jgi:serine/threonine protein phosphatase 1
MKRTLVIGDIHGGLRALQQVLEKAAVTSSDTLIFLGDYVDGWSESAAVVERVIQLSQQQQCIFIKGNHDVWCEEWLRTGYADSTWLFHGGEPYYHIDDQNRLFIHAGFTSMHGPQKEFHSSNFSWDRTLWEMAITMDKRIQRDSLLYPKRLKLFSEIYIGHTPTLYYDVEVPMQGCNVWNVDTGAAFTGKLSIMDIDSKEYWQSTELRKLYAGERGRNRG